MMRISVPNIRTGSRSKETSFPGKVIELLDRWTVWMTIRGTAANLPWFAWRGGPRAERIGDMLEYRTAMPPPFPGRLVYSGIDLPPGRQSPTETSRLRSGTRPATFPPPRPRQSSPAFVPNLSGSRWIFQMAVFRPRPEPVSPAEPQSFSPRKKTHGLGHL